MDGWLDGYGIIVNVVSKSFLYTSRFFIGKVQTTSTMLAFIFYFTLDPKKICSALSQWTQQAFFWCILVIIRTTI